MATYCTDYNAERFSDKNYDLQGLKGIHKKKMKLTESFLVKLKGTVLFER